MAAAEIQGFRQEIGEKEPIIYVPYEEAYAEGFEDMDRRVPDIARINQLTGWQPQINLEDILRDVITDLRPPQPSL